MRHSHQTEVGLTTCRRVTYRHGEAAEATACAAVWELERGGERATEAPNKLLLSADGSFIHLTNGQWCEVKSVAVGEFESVAETGASGGEVKTKAISYFTRSYGARDFERYALAELHRRGLDKARQVVAVNDGAEWIQNFLDYHTPQAVRIIDFAHALSYVADAGKAIWGEGSETFSHWFARCAHQLKHEPPQATLAELSLLRPKAKRDEQAAALDRAGYYLSKRRQMIDYPYFRKRGYPIGSGSVESGHKVVVQRRLKGAGMRWAAHHVDPLLALRDLLCNDRWAAGWRDIVAQQQQQRRRKQLQRLPAQQPPRATSFTFAALEAAGLLPPPAVPSETPQSGARPNRPAKDHPWRRDIWPTKEAWRWS